ncbi:hypothetical protein Tco_1067106 [Tanacetum coccineum]|uniref:Uncharacterized protein n=1 Tax=Tanacetum coccineum TaxID=301880 RepID=A0ABQ5HBX9_9ASTR
MFDEVQAGIDADILFAAKLQQEEIKEYTVEESAKFLAGTIAVQTKFRAAQRAAEIKNDAVKDSKEAAGVNKQEVIEEPNSTMVEVKQEGHEESIRKRPGRRLKMKATKKKEYPLTKENLSIMLSLRLELAGTATLAIPEQTATGKEISNPFMASSLPKTTKLTEFKDLSTVAERYSNDASKQGRIDDVDAEVTFIDETSNDARNKNNKISNNN